MGKRSSFDRVPRDFYPTPVEAVRPLLPHLIAGTVFVEPCAGDGALIDHLQGAGHRCTFGIDIAPIWPIVRTADATTARYNMGGATCFITNPPWSRDVLHPIITNLSSQAPTWLLFDADWIHTRQAVPFLPLLQTIVSVGRVKWIPGSKMTGKDNCAWHLFDSTPDASRWPAAAFYGRKAA